MTRTLAWLGTCGAIALVVPSVAAAETFCVGTGFGCSGTDEPDLQSALDDAAVNADAGDTVRVGPGTFPGTANDVPGNRVTIVGSGTGKTKLTGNGSWVLAVFEPASKVKHLRIHTTTPPTGLRLEGHAVDVSVTAPAGATKTGVEMSGPSSLRKSTVTLPSDTLSTGVLNTGGGDRLITESKVKAGFGVVVDNDAGTTTSVQRSRVNAFQGLFSKGGALEIDDTLVRIAPAVDPYLELGIGANAFSNPSPLTASHVTVIGRGTGSESLGALASFNAGATLTVRNSVFAQNSFDFEIDSPASGTISYTRYLTRTGGGSVSEDNVTTANPRFVGGSNYRLKPSSSLIDAGDPAGLAPGEPTEDLDGHPRILNGDGQGGARRDMGAYELLP